MAQTYSISREKLQALMNELAFQSYMPVVRDGTGTSGHGHSDKDIYSWWQESRETIDRLLPGHGSECQVIFRRGIAWISQRCQPPAPSPKLTTVVCRHLEQIGAVPLSQEDGRHWLNPLTQLGQLGKEKYLTRWAQAEARAKATAGAAPIEDSV